MSDVLDEIVSKLKQKAFQHYELPRWILRRHEWVKLEDVEEAIQQIKQKHVIIEKKKLEDFRCFVRKKAEECLREMETEEGIIREGLEARLGVYDEITLKLEELLRRNEG